ncbi:MAG: succinate dehydrogenase cytochrome b subunit [Bacteroidota bacterium]|nr:succinate dehydrogenase cytochrome b subunit [Candidatus Kapabacteria bacterium]MCS7302580.1 succinate dehydrogenase cytochrome b subunit [Candidatus Kapabacteria bacterium]MCX7936723.1 succinate dehydrogenase cytochrome b subunit [Chlorobiota bacterium]MDW8074233.1 succinate dehydrogenase cytochrome b subunit [Bacteroidota bacterium]MDW8271291.1 succinate dehydrogenase cytochrome b subunit [Bacteroidota bacterium]
MNDSAMLRTTVMQKSVVAITGLVMVLFLIAHLSGNLLVFAGPDAINSYAAGLRDVSALLWTARIVLLASLVLHVYFTVRLRQLSREARPIQYRMQRYEASTFASRTMLISGLVIFSYVAFHLAHFTWGKIYPQYYAATYFLDGRGPVHDVYSMVVRSFQEWWISALYIVAVTFVMIHLVHATQSALQTLGIYHKRYVHSIRKASIALAIVLWVGYVLIPLASLTRILKPLT